MAKHLNILDPEEITDLYGLPKFNMEQRQIFFDLTLEEWMIAQKYRTRVLQVYFILQLGYFKAKQQFYIFELSDVHSDSEYVKEKYFAEESTLISGSISKPTRLNQQRAILRLSGFRKATAAIRIELQAKAEGLVKIHSKAYLCTTVN